VFLHLLIDELGAGAPQRETPPPSQTNVVFAEKLQVGFLHFCQLVADVLLELGEGQSLGVGVLDRDGVSERREVGLQERSDAPDFVQLGG